MRKLYSAVLVGAFALGFTACSQDVSGPSGAPQFNKQSAPGQLSQDTARTPGCPGVILDEAPESAKAPSVREKCSGL